MGPLGFCALSRILVGGALAPVPSSAWELGRLPVPTSAVDSAEGPIAFVDEELCLQEEAEIRGVEFFSPVLDVKGFFLQVWRRCAVGDNGADGYELVAQAELLGRPAPGGVFSVSLALQASVGDCVGWAHHRAGGGVVGYEEAPKDGDKGMVDVRFARFPVSIRWPLALGSRISMRERVRRLYAIRIVWEPPGCWEDGRSWLACCGLAKGMACWPTNPMLYHGCCGPPATATSWAEQFTVCNDCVPLTWRFPVDSNLDA